MSRVLPSVVLLAAVAFASPARGQSETAPIYRVFLTDGTSLTSFGEWARIDDRVVFSMPLRAVAEVSELHLVSLAASRIDWARTERYADAVRAARYAASRGEGDFARLSADIARTLNEVALVQDPRERLARAEQARRSLAEWPGAHHGYRAKEVGEIVGVLDQVISGLRGAVGVGRYDLALVTTTAPAPPEPLALPPDQSEIVQQLLAASAVVDSPAEKISLLQTVVGLIDSAVGLLPEGLASRLRATALGALAEEQRVDAAYARLRTSMLTTATRHTERADVRGLTRLRSRLRDQDTRLGGRRPDESHALMATLDAHLEAAHRLRLARDQWLLRLDGVRAYQRATKTAVDALKRAQKSLDDIRALAGPTPQELRLLAIGLERENGRLRRTDPPADLGSVHAVLRSACEMAEQAARLRLDAAYAADMTLAQQASSAAAGAQLLFSRAVADLKAALRPPTVSDLMALQEAPPPQP